GPSNHHHNFHAAETIRWKIDNPISASNDPEKATAHVPNGSRSDCSATAPLRYCSRSPARLVATNCFVSGCGAPMKPGIRCISLLQIVLGPVLYAVMAQTSTLVRSALDDTSPDYYREAFTASLWFERCRERAACLDYYTPAFAAAALAFALSMSALICASRSAAWRCSLAFCKWACNLELSWLIFSWSLALRSA